jgi:hypothetical protein
MCLMMMLIEKGVSLKRTDRKTFNLRGLMEEKKLYF